MKRFPARVILAATLLWLGRPPAVAGQVCGRSVDYDSRIVVTSDNPWACQFQAKVVDLLCPIEDAQGDTIEYVPTVITPAGQEPCDEYMPAYTGFCRDTIANTPGVTSPSQLAAVTVSDTQVLLTWRDNSARCECRSTQGACPPAPLPAWHGFSVERKDDATFAAIATLGAATMVDPNVTPGSIHTYRVRAFDGYGPSPYTNEVTLTVGATASTPPCCVSARVEQGNGGRYVSLSWGQFSLDETGFRVERSVRPGPWTTVAQVPADTTTAADMTVTPGVTYTYRVVAYNTHAASFSSEVVARVP